MEVSDSELVRSVLRGDDDAFHQLVDRHSKTMFRVAMSLSHNRSDAEDLLQEAFVSAHKSLKSFAGRSSFKTWLLTILTRHAYRSWHRSKNRRATMSLSHVSDAGESDSDRQTPVVSKESATAVERKIDVMETLRQMTDPHREVLVLREIQGLSYEEIAEVLKIPRGTVESRIFRARAEFREKYGSRDE